MQPDASRSFIRLLSQSKAT